MMAEVLDGAAPRGNAALTRAVVGVAAALAVGVYLWRR